MIKEERINIFINSVNLKHYKRLGYDAKCLEYCDVLVSDVGHQSKARVTAICSCGNETPISIQKYYTNVARGGEYGCRQCSRKRAKLTNLERFGVDNYAKTVECRERTKQTNLERCGVECNLSLKSNQEKVKATNLERYGVEYPMQSKEIRDKGGDTFFKNYGNRQYILSDTKKERDIEKWIKRKVEQFESVGLVFSHGDYTTKTSWVSCDKGHTFEIYDMLTHNRIIQKTTICTICNSIGNTMSGLQDQIADFIEKQYTGLVLRGDRKTLSKTRELDVYLPELNVAVEFDGIYWHNELYKAPEYHLEKTIECNTLGIELIHVWEDDWNLKKDIIKSILLNKLNLTQTKIAARKCVIKELSFAESNAFLNVNHLQGACKSKISIGLYYDDQLVSVIAFSSLRKVMGQTSKEGSYELIRFASLINTVVVGGASKLFSYFIKTYTPKYIISYADISRNDGGLYKTLGFKHTHDTPPNYYYVVNERREHRFNYRKDVLVAQGYDQNKTEKEIMFERGKYRVYDCGNSVWVWNA